MKRSIALLLAMVMVIGMIPVSLLPALAHGSGVGKDNIENLSIDNAPNQKIPATVDVDGIANDTAWAGDEWNYADAQDGIWNASLVKNPDFTYKYQLHLDYQYVYGVIVADISTVKHGKVEDFTIWLNDGKSDTSYTAKIVLTPTYTDGEITAVALSRYKVDGTVITDDGFAEYDFEKVLSDFGFEDGIVTIEFKSLISSITGEKQAETNYSYNLSAFVSAKIVGDDNSAQYLYHPRVDAATDNTQIDLENNWSDNAVSITQKEIYPEDSALTDYSLVVPDPIVIDGKLDEEAWSLFSDYGATDYSSFYDYSTNAEHKVSGLDGLYSVYHRVNNKDVGFHSGHSSTVTGQCNQTCELNYINNLPVKFKYDVKSNGTYLYGGVNASVSVYDDNFYYNRASTGVYDTYFKVMLSAPDGNNVQLEMKQSMTKNIDSAYSDGSFNTRVLTANSHFIEAERKGGNSVLPDGVGAYARRINAFNMQFEFCLSYAAINQAFKNRGLSTTVKAGDTLKVLICVANESSGSGSAGPNTATGVYANSGGYYAHAGYSDPLGRLNDHIHVLRSAPDANNPNFSPSVANGSFDDGIFGNLKSADRFINASYRPNSFDAGDTGYTPGNVNELGNYLDKSPGAITNFRYDIFMSGEYLYGAAVVQKHGYDYIDASSLSTTFDSSDSLRIWVNNDTPQWRDHYDSVLSINLNSGKVSINRHNYYSDSYVGSDGTYKDGGAGYYHDLDKGIENFGSLGNATAVVRKNPAEFLGDTSFGDVAFVEFKIPLEEIGVTEKEIKNTDENTDDIALSYFVSAETVSGGAAGIVHPIANNRVLNANDSTAEFYIKDKFFHQTFSTSTDSSVPLQGTWVATKFSGINGAMIIKTNERTNQFEINGALEETIWNDEEERIHVDSTSGSWGEVPDAEQMFDYSYKVYAGREYLYGMAQINTAAGDNEELDFTLWINNAPETSTKATSKFRIVQEGDKTVCYDLDGEKYTLTKTVKKYNTNHIDTYTAEITNGKVAMTTINGITYVEFMLSLEGCGIVLHELGENAFIQYGSKAEGNTGEFLYSTDKFYSYFGDDGKPKVNKKLGYEYFVSVTKKTTVDNQTLENTLYYPRVQGNGVDGLWITKVNSIRGTNQAGIWKNYTSTTPDLQYGHHVILVPVDGYQDLYTVARKSYGNADTDASTYTTWRQAFMATYDQYKDIPGAFVYSAWSSNSHGYKVVQSLADGDCVRIKGIDLSPERLANLDTSIIPLGDANYSVYANGTKGYYVNSTIEIIDMTSIPEISEEDKFPHLTDNNEGGDRWDASNALKITPLDYFVPEFIEIDGDLSDSGWADDMWIEVAEEVNGNLQNPRDKLKGATPTDYKFQIRTDGEYMYVAAVLNIPCSPVRHDVTCNCTDCRDKGTFPFYSVPVFRMWIQSKDKQFKLEATQNNGETIIKTFEDAVSFTHLYHLELAANKNTGAPSTKTFEIENKAEYVPETYVTWEGNDVEHVGADKYVTLNDALNPTKLIMSGTTLRTAFHEFGFWAPRGGNARSANDPLGIKHKDGTYRTVTEKPQYEDSEFYGTTGVIEENTVEAKGENAYTDKDWYAKPEIQEYVYGNERGIMTSDETGKKTYVEFKFPLSEIGCDDGDDFEYIVQGGTSGLHTDTNYTLFYPFISFGLNKISGRSSSVDGRPYWLWASTAELVDEKCREEIKLRNNYELVSPIGVQFTESYKYNDTTYSGLKFGMLYDADYVTQQNDTSGLYEKATYWDIKEIGMLIANSDSLENDSSNLVTEKVDDKKINRVESDAILDHVQDTVMADYDSYIFYAIKLLNEGDKNKKYTYRGFVEYYSSNHMYYDMADKVFSSEYPWTYSTSESNGRFLGKPLELTGGSNNPADISATPEARPTYYTDTVTRSLNMIKYADTLLKSDTNLPTDKEIKKPVNANGATIAYVPIDDRPINLERVIYQAEAAGFNIIMPDMDDIATRIDTYAEGKSDQGNPKELYTWLKNVHDKKLAQYYVISIDQMLSGGLVGSREPFYDTDGDSIANMSVIANYDTEKGGYTLTDDENMIIELLKTIATDDSVYSVFFDTIKRLASTGNYFAMNMGNYGEWRTYGAYGRQQLYGSDLTINNIVAGYNYDENGKAIAKVLTQDVVDTYSGLTDYAGNKLHSLDGFTVGTDYYFGYESTYKAEQNGEKITYTRYVGVDATNYKMYMAARERKLRIADALYPTVGANADSLFIGFDDSKPYTTMQTNDGRYISEKLVKGYDRCYVFSGTDELGMMGVTTIATDLYGKVSANAVFFGPGKDVAGDDYDTGTLYQNVMTHITGVGGTYAYNGDGEVDILILTRSDMLDGSVGYSESDQAALVESAKELINRVDVNLKNNVPTIVVDCAFNDAYDTLASMMMNRYKSGEYADISGRLNQLLCYSQWNTTANALGTAICNGLSRYTYLKNCKNEDGTSAVTEASHMGAAKVNAKAWVKDYAYQSTEVGDGNFARSKPYNGSDTFASRYNNFWSVTEYVMNKLNATSIATGVDENGKLVIPEDYAYQTAISNLYWRWDRSFEANFDIDVKKTEEFVRPVYDDYKVSNIALGKDYTSTIQPGAAYPDIDHELTNGLVYKYAEPSNYDYEHPYLVGYAYQDSSTVASNGYKSFDIDIDLEDTYNIYQVMVYYLNSNTPAGVYSPANIQLYTSETGEEGSYVLQRTKNTSADGTGAITCYLGTNTTMAKARYVKLRITQKMGSTWFHVSEIQVLGMDPTKADYVSSTATNWFNYDGLDTDYIYTHWTGEMAYDADQRLRIFNGHILLDNPSAVYNTTGGCKYFSGWSDEIDDEDGTGWLDIQVNVDPGYYLTRFDVHFATGPAGFAAAKAMKLYYEDSSGNWVEVPTNFYSFKYMNPDANSQSTYFGATVCILELQEEITATKYKISAQCGNMKTMCFTGIRMALKTYANYPEEYHPN